jgi:hypothetical protein
LGAPARRLEREGDDRRGHSRQGGCRLTPDERPDADDDRHVHQRDEDHHRGQQQGAVDHEVDVEQVVPQHGDADRDRDQAEGHDGERLDDPQPAGRGSGPPGGVEREDERGGVEDRDRGRGGDEPPQLQPLDPRGPAEPLHETHQRADHADRQHDDRGRGARQHRPKRLGAERVHDVGERLLEPPRAEQDRQVGDHHADAQDPGEPPPARGRQVPVGEEQQQERRRQADDRHPHRLIDREGDRAQVVPADSAVDRVARVGPDERAQAEGGADPQHQPADRVVRPADRQDVPDDREQAEAEEEGEVGLELPGIEDREPDAGRDTQDRQAEDDAGEQPQATRARRRCRTFGRSRHGGMVPRPPGLGQARAPPTGEGRSSIQVDNQPSVNVH